MTNICFYVSTPKKTSDDLTTKSEKKTINPAKQLGKQMRDFVPGSRVNVALVGDKIFSSLAQGNDTILTPSEMIKQIKKVDPEGVVTYCNYKKASKQDLDALFLTKAPECSSIKLKGYENLTAPFLKKLATVRPNLTLLDLRNTHQTAELIESFLSEQNKNFKATTDVTRVVKITKENLSNEERKIFEEKYPDVAFVDDNSHLDLSGTHISLEMIIKKIKAQPNLKTVDLSNIPELNPFTLFRLEKELHLNLSYTLNGTVAIPELTGTDEKTGPTTIQEIEAFLERFQVKELDLCAVKDLTLMDLLYLHEIHPNISFPHSVEMNYTMPLFDLVLIEKLCLKFRELSLDLLNITGEEERALTKILDDHRNVEFKNRERLTLLQQNLPLLQFYLHRAVNNHHKTTLTQSDLTKLGCQCPAIKSTVDKICERLTSKREDSSAPLHDEIDQLELDHVVVPSVRLNTSETLSYSLEKLITQYGKVESKAKLKAYKAAYENSLGEKLRGKNDVEAAKHFIIAAELGDAIGKYNLGLAFQNGKGVTKDPQKAAELIKEAAEQGCAHAQNKMGRISEDNEDYAKAFEWYSKASQQGLAYAQYNMGRMYMLAKGVEKDEEIGLWYITRAANQKYADALYSLGCLFEAGKGVPKNLERAIELYKEAAAQNFQKAIDALKRLETK